VLIQQETHLEENQKQLMHDFMLCEIVSKRTIPESVNIIRKVHGGHVEKLLVQAYHGQCSKSAEEGNEQSGR
jgi:hypothetical protein